MIETSEKETVETVGKLTYVVPQVEDTNLGFDVAILNNSVTRDQGGGLDPDGGLHAKKNTTWFDEPSKSWTDDEAW